MSVARFFFFLLSGMAIGILVTLGTAAKLYSGDVVHPWRLLGTSLVIAIVLSILWVFLVNLVI